MWQLDTDTRAAHLGAALGYLGDDDRAPTYRVGRALYERTWSDGRWDGPDEDRPAQAPDYLRAVCACGWTSPALVDMHLTLPLGPERPAPFSLRGQDKARAYWLAHALAATSPAHPRGAEEAIAQTQRWLDTLVKHQPLAGLGLARDLRAATDTAEASAVRHARALGTSWDEIGEALGTTRQQAWRKYRNLPPLTSEESREILHPSFPPGYQHRDGRPNYTVSDVEPNPPMG